MRFGKKAVFAGTLLVLFFTVACYKVPVTGRNQFILLPESFELKMGATSFANLTRTEKISKNPEYAMAVKRVAQRIAAVSSKPKYRWQYVVFDNDDNVNAFALPGGKIGVYSGMMPVAKTDAGLATVIAHEVAHAVARHGGERVSFGLLLQLGSAAVATALENKDPKVIRSVLAAYGVGTTVLAALPFSRKQETEADRIGLIYMAKAGYDPRESIAFWQRMGKQSGSSTPQFLSTHPGYKTRISNLRKWMPDAMQHYRNSSKAPNNVIKISVRKKR